MVARLDGSETPDIEVDSTSFVMCGRLVVEYDEVEVTGKYDGAADTDMIGLLVGKALRSNESQLR